LRASHCDKDGLVSMKVGRVGAMLTAALLCVLTAAPASASVPRAPLDDLVPPVELPGAAALPALPLLPTVPAFSPMVSPVVSPLLAQLGLDAASRADAAPDPGPAPGAPPPQARSDAATASVVADATPSAAPRASITGERIEPVTGTSAVLRLARSSTALLVLLVAAVAFLLVQGRVDRRSPRLASAPLDRRDELLEFS
jgi:hypothetical protein